MSRPAYSEQHTEAIREELTKGAVVLFRRQGSDSLTLRKLADHLKMSHTKLYRYFESKDALLDAVRLTSLGTLEAMLLERDPVGADPLTRLQAASKTLHDYAKEYRKEYLFLFVEDSTASSPAFTRKRHLVFNHIVEIATLAHEQGYTALDGRTLANLSWATLHGLFLLNFSGQLIEGRSFETLLASAMGVLFGSSGQAAA